MSRSAPEDVSVLQLNDSRSPDVQSCHQFLEATDKLPTKIANSTKFPDFAQELRSDGNKAYNRREDGKALLLYTQSIAMAETDSEELALAFANRSAVLFRLKNYFACFLDINRALNGKYPESLRWKLRSRKKQCITKIEHQNRENTAWLENLDSQSRENPSKFLFMMMRNRRVLKIDENSTEPEDQLPPLPEIQSANKLLPGASSKIKINFNENWGRHFVATQNIEPGEILVVERAFASALEVDRCRSHCSFCFIQYSALIPCPGCSLVMYCGDRCRLQAYESYHRIECELSPFLANMSYSDADLVILRMVLIGTKQGQELVRLSKNKYFKNLLGKRPKYQENQKYKRDYLFICNLDIGSKKDTPEWSMAHFICTRRSTVLLYLLKQSSFFDAAKKQEEDLSRVESFVADLLLNHCLVLRFNSFAIHDNNVNLCLKEERWNDIGTGVNSLLGLLNHSCDPNVNIISNRDSSIMFAVQPIAAGEQVFASYFDRYYNKTIEERQHFLNRYGFKCRCDACVFNWPLFEELPTKNPKYLCSDPDLEENLAKCSALFVHWRHPESEASFNERFKFMCDYCFLLHKLIAKPWKEAVEVQQKISQMTMIKYGNFYFYECDHSGCM